MKAVMEMQAEPLFGGQVRMAVTAEVDNARMLTNRTLFTDMARMLRHMADELHAESERVLAEDGGEGMRRAQVREQDEADNRERDRLLERTPG